eukprot:scaffold326857_cov52-Tisochrysis_lutea.AAC.1
MSRRAGITHVAVRWCTFGAEGDTWESEPNVYPPSKIEDFKNQEERGGGAWHAIRPQLHSQHHVGEDHSRSSPTIPEFGKLPGVSYKMEKEAGAERHFAMVESLDGAAAFLLGHVARPGVANEWLPSDH